MSTDSPRPPFDFDLLCQVGLSAELCQGGPGTWEWLRSMSPPPDALVKTSPITAALLRVATPGSWLTLRADHLDAVLEAENRPFGFLTLVVEEAQRMAAEEPRVVGRATGQVMLLYLLLKHHEPHPVLTAASQRLMALLANVLLTVDEPSRVEKTLAGAADLGEPPDDVTRLRLLETRARWMSHTRPASTPYTEALAASHSLSPVRSLEVLAEAVVQGAVSASGPASLQVSVARARGLARSASRDVVRAHTLCHAGWLAARAARKLIERPVRAGQPPSHLSLDLAELAGEVESAESLVRTVGDDVGLGFWLLALGRLRLFHTPRSAVEPLRQAVELLSAGPRALLQDARDALAEATGEPRSDPSSGGSSGPPVSTQAFPPEAN